MSWPRIVSDSKSPQRPAPSTPHTATLPPAIEMELRAMRICYAELSALDAEAQARAIEWVQRQLEKAAS